MVNKVNNEALTTLLNTQNASSQSSLSTLKNNPAVGQSIVASSQNAVSTKNAATTNSGAASLNTAPYANQLADAQSNPPPSNLPRGSLVDILA
ncbi:MAG: hypothetical protein AB7S81_05045 [Bdellovibrionales bacterium]